MEENILRRLRVALTCVALLVLAFIAIDALAVTPYDGSRNFPARVLSTQQVHYYRFIVNFNDPQIGTFQRVGTLQQNAFIENVEVEVVTAFNAGTTNTLTVGTTSTSINELVASGDLAGNGTSSLSTQVARVTRAFGRSLTSAADVGIFVKYAQTGGAATTGQAIVIVTYIPNNDQ